MIETAVVVSTIVGVAIAGVPPLAIGLWKVSSWQTRVEMMIETNTARVRRLEDRTGINKVAK